MLVPFHHRPRNVKVNILRPSFADKDTSQSMMRGIKRDIDVFISISIVLHSYMDEVTVNCIRFSAKNSTALLLYNDCAGYGRCHTPPISTPYCECNIQCTSSCVLKTYLELNRKKPSNTRSIPSYLKLSV